MVEADGVIAGRNCGLWVYTSRMTTLTQNRRAAHEYQILAKFEAGIALQGTEVKSCRKHDIALTDAYAEVQDGELWLVGAHIAPYSHGNRANHEPRRRRKLLMHKREIGRLLKDTAAKGMTLIPLRFFLDKGKIKVELGLCKGKNLYDKREAMKNKDQEREIRRTLRGERA